MAETLADLFAEGSCPECGTFGGIWHKLGCSNDPRTPDPTVAEKVWGTQDFQVERDALVAAVKHHRDTASPTSTPQKHSRDGELYAVLDELEGR